MFRQDNNEIEKKRAKNLVRFLVYIANFFETETELHGGIYLRFLSFIKNFYNLVLQANITMGKQQVNNLHIDSATRDKVITCYNFLKERSYSQPINLSDDQKEIYVKLDKTADVMRGVFK